MKKSRRILSIILTALMVVTMLPLSVMTASAVNYYDYNITIEVVEWAVYDTTGELIGKFNAVDHGSAFYDELLTKADDGTFTFSYKLALERNGGNTAWDESSISFKIDSCEYEFWQSFEKTCYSNYNIHYKLEVTRSAGHSFTDWTDVGDGTHTRICTVNSTHIETFWHNFTETTCVKAGYCTQCGAVNGEINPDAHTFGAWSPVGDGTHTRVCKNDTNHIETVNCSYITATCTDAAKCETCGYISGEPDGENHTSTIFKYEQNSADGHKKYHSCCMVYAGVEAHEYNNGVCKICAYQCLHPSYTDGVCDDCGHKCQHNIADKNCIICGKQGIPYVYREWDEATGAMIEYTDMAPANATVVTDSTTAMSDGWYIVNSDVTVSSVININGEVHLILADGVTLTASTGVHLPEEKTLYIYSQSTTDNMGGLIATGAYFCAGIGGKEKEAVGTLIIHGGIITATGGTLSSSIGGGNRGSGGTLIVNGGKVIANGGDNGAGIGGGQDGNGGTVIINGGKVIANGGSYSAGIGGGIKGNGGAVTINGGCVEATGDSYSAGIGGAYMGDGGTVVITGGNVKAVAGWGAEAIGKGYDGSISGTLTDGNGNVDLNTITLSGASADMAVTKAEGITYGLTDVKTIDTDKLYFYLPADIAATSITAGENEYICKSNLTYYTEHDWSDNDGVCIRCGYECAHENQTGIVCEICGGKTHFCSFEQNGFCPICDSYEPAKLNDGYYQIANAGQLFWFANYINTVDRTANAVLVDDIDLENRPWSPIGFTNEKNNNFRGHFDGQDHTITGLYVEGDRAGLGFFGEVRTGTVENFTIYGEVVVNKEYNYVGGVIGSACGLNSSDHGLERNGATIRNITSYVNLTAGAHGIGMVGGFIGYANHETLIENCSWYGNFDAGIYRVDSGAGGFIGRIYDSASVTIRNCAAYGTITTEYKSGTFESKDNIYIGGFLSYSPSGAQTVMENNLWAGRIINNTNLSAENAHLSAYGTLTSFKSVTNCYMEEGSAAYITTSNVNTDGITTATAAQLKSGEVAYLLQGEQTEDIWGQKIGTDDYPVLGGAKVYQVTNCKDEAVYSNTNANGAHSYENGTCTVCGTTVFSLINGAAFDSTDSYIFGFAPGITSLDDYTDILVDGYEWTYIPGQFGGFGTGTKAELKNGDTTVAEYTLLIYGDVNGDGWYDGEDAFLTNLIVAGMLTQENIPDYLWRAADCNHDGVIDEADVDLLSGAGLKKNDIDQNAAQSELSTQAAYIEYMSIIVQSAGLDIEPDTDETQQGTTTPETNETVEPDEPATENDIDIEVIFTNIFEFFKSYLHSYFHS